MAGQEAEVADRGLAGDPSIRRSVISHLRDQSITDLQLHGQATGYTSNYGKWYIVFTMCIYSSLNLSGELTMGIGRKSFNHPSGRAEMSLEKR